MIVFLRGGGEHFGIFEENMSDGRLKSKLLQICSLVVLLNILVANLRAQRLSESFCLEMLLPIEHIFIKSITTPKYPTL